MQILVVIQPGDIVVDEWEVSSTPRKGDKVTVQTDSLGHREFMVDKVIWSFDEALGFREVSVQVDIVSEPQ